MTSPPTPKDTLRVTVVVTPEVHTAFKRISAAGSMSVGRAMGEWLGDTLDAANHVATLMENARAAPRVVTQQLHAYALGLADETGELMEKIRRKGIEDRAAVAASAGSADRFSVPPSSNTGGKGPKSTTQKPPGASK